MIIFDDTVLDKSSSRVIDGVYKQYSGNKHHVINGIGLVTCVYYNPRIKRFYILDYRIYDPKRDGKTKISHVLDMFAAASDRGVDFSHVLMDSWYATTQIMNYIVDIDKLFICAIKSNRLFSLDMDNERKKDYVKVCDLEWNEHTSSAGYQGKLKHLPTHRPVKLFRVVISTDKIEYIITNDVTITTADDARTKSATRWKIEEFHREIKQLTGIEKCQARLNRSQRNHIAIAILVWIKLKIKAWATSETIYQLKRKPLQAYVAQLWQNPANTYT